MGDKFLRTIEIRGADSIFPALLQGDAEILQDFAENTVLPDIMAHGQGSLCTQTWALKPYQRERLQSNNFNVFRTENAEEIGRPHHQLVCRLERTLDVDVGKLIGIVGAFDNTSTEEIRIASAEHRIQPLPTSWIVLCFGID